MAVVVAVVVAAVVAAAAIAAIAAIAAMAAAAALDACHFSEIVGCIAGDDTIMCVIRSTDDAVKTMDKISKIVL